MFFVFGEAENGSACMVGKKTVPCSVRGHDNTLLPSCDWLCSSDLVFNRLWNKKMLKKKTFMCTPISLFDLLAWNVLQIGEEEEKKGAHRSTTHACRSHRPVNNETSSWSWKIARSAGTAPVFSPHLYWLKSGVHSGVLRMMRGL